MIRKFFLLIGLGRALMSPITMSAPVFGALSVRSIEPGEIFALALVGLCAHLHGFILNDLLDFKLDRTLSYRKSNPLLTGRITTREALLFALFQIPLALGIYGLLLKGSPKGLLVLIASLFLSLIYNLWSKWGPLPKWMPELALALSIGALCLAGTLTTAENLSTTSILLCLGLSVCLLLLNSVPSGLKDLKTDSAYGAQSFVIWMNARLIDEEHCIIPGRLWVYSFSLQTIYILVLFALSRTWRLPWWLTGFCMLLCLGAVWHLQKILSTRSFTKMLKDQPLLSGVYNYCALAIILLPVMPIWAVILIVLLTLIVVLKPMSLTAQMSRTNYGYFDPDRYF